MTLASKLKRGVAVALIMAVAVAVRVFLINEIPLTRFGGELLRAVLDTANLTTAIYFVCRVLGVPIGRPPRRDGGG